YARKITETITYNQLNNMRNKLEPKTKAYLKKTLILLSFGYLISTIPNVVALVLFPILFRFFSSNEFFFRMMEIVLYNHSKKSIRTPCSYISATLYFIFKRVVKLMH